MKPSALVFRRAASPQTLSAPGSSQVRAVSRTRLTDHQLTLDSAFKDMSKRFPLYGKHADPPIDPGEWWTRLIRSCISHAGASEHGELRIESGR